MIRDLERRLMAAYDDEEALRALSVELRDLGRKISRLHGETARRAVELYRRRVTGEER